VPYVSATFAGHTITVRPPVSDYDHSQMWLRKNNDPANDPHFIRIGQDLADIAATVLPPSYFYFGVAQACIGTSSLPII